jgi:hypothetical protein
MTDTQYQTVLSILIIIILFISAPLLIALFYLDIFDTPTPALPEAAIEDLAPIAEAAPAQEIIVPPMETEEEIPPQKMPAEYIKITDGCGAHFEGECLNVRSGPSTEFPVVAQLRNGMVLKIETTIEAEGKLWHKVVFDEWLRYPERVTEEWYVAADHVEKFTNEGVKTAWEDKIVASDKQIVVSRVQQKLSAYEGEHLVMEMPISTGLELTPTPRGTFTIYKKTPSRYMQGPLPDMPVDQYYDLPGVPWNLYFTHEGAVIHGAYWHTSFGSPYSHGCVNIDPKLAEDLYLWAALGTKVVVKD